MKKNPDLVAFGRNVAALRKDNNLTQEVLAERSELDASPFNAFNAFNAFNTLIRLS